MKHLHALSADHYAFDDTMNSVHVDKKWFFAIKISSKMYLAPGDEPPHRTCKSKRILTKVLFLRNCAAGTLVTKPVSVTRKMLIDNVIPAIKAKWPKIRQGASQSSKTMHAHTSPHWTLVSSIG
ncbi:hypothetical protein H257_01517 [Aphanomyces astaci]|uniref:Uncharacterized protein n=1 Tax=Aphanomyces astaci TaxID=112090 RepID=W4H9G9_APHAT|nr:hypothetical protein H257_01517 [Aphanomyces astaci]ETV88211.1 hypothetical protein H257_01517 [Aphanomyces astaci]|eukprot:XP_009823074.1 hypothetical protein H257_01517 [Aphanomyces astaci]